MRMNDIPLFPLNTVLFPRMMLPLLIFEPRYRLMVAECLKDKTPFGVVLLQEGNEVQEGRPDQTPVPVRPYTVGTLAQITEVARLDDGRMMLTTVGTERFRLIEYRQHKAYMTGDIEIWPDGGADPARLENEAEEVRQALRNYLQILLELAGKEAKGFELPADPETLANLIPNWLYVGLPEKQRLLETADPYTRLVSEKEILLNETDFFYKVKEKAAEQGWTETNLPNMPGRSPLVNPPGYDPGSRFSPN